MVGEGEAACKNVKGCGKLCLGVILAGEAV